MHVETITRAVCDVCGATGPEALEGEDAVELAKKRGWMHHEVVDETICALCTASSMQGAGEDQ